MYNLIHFFHALYYWIAHCFALLLSSTLNNITHPENYYDFFNWRDRDVVQQLTGRTRQWSPHDFENVIIN